MYLMRYTNISFNVVLLFWEYNFQKVNILILLAIKGPNWEAENEWLFNLTEFFPER